MFESLDKHRNCYLIIFALLETGNLHVEHFEVSWAPDMADLHFMLHTPVLRKVLD